ncbi:hypothetical protein [Paenibacillus qinlingensis]|uniref:hypothetical protein n=1 Tax=Paenibacillus qinlingensis TaxID=1837343 RepID=UPI0015642FDE|nr:hypothetical protein [Paenibacillus qinlingensis]NQX57528.1 hypothetical protein [Paenibacillus qinlingensis]
MFNTTEVKTWQPIIPAGLDPVCISPDDSVDEIVGNLGKAAKVKFKFTEFAIMRKTIVDGLKMLDWLDGEYTVFPD